jgi:hypothetical protein
MSSGDGAATGPFSKQTAEQAWRDSVAEGREWLPTWAFEVGLALVEAVRGAARHAAEEVR